MLLREGKFAGNEIQNRMESLQNGVNVLECEELKGQYEWVRRMLNESGLAEIERLFHLAGGARVDALKDKFRKVLDVYDALDSVEPCIEKYQSLLDWILDIPRHLKVV